jgi:hypothetical protein
LVRAERLAGAFAPERLAPVAVRVALAFGEGVLAAGGLAARFVLRRCGRERGSCPRRSDERSSVIESQKITQVTSNLKRICRFYVTV